MLINFNIFIKKVSSYFRKFLMMKGGNVKYLLNNKNVFVFSKIMLEHNLSEH